MLSAADIAVIVIVALALVGLGLMEAKHERWMRDNQDDED